MKHKLNTARFLKTFLTLIFTSFEQNPCCRILLCDRHPWCLEEKAGSLQRQFKTMAVCCSAVSLSVCLFERGRAAGSDEATHTLLERNDHLSPCDSQGLGYKSKGRKAQRNGGREQAEVLQKTILACIRFFCVLNVLYSGVYMTNKQCE